MPIIPIVDADKVFKALADPSRRQLLDWLHGDNGQTLGELCEDLDMTRQAVTKHLALLEDANLVVTIRRGREKRRDQRRRKALASPCAVSGSATS